MAKQNHEFKSAHGIAKWTLGVVSPRKFQEYPILKLLLTYYHYNVHKLLKLACHGVCIQYG